MSSRAWIVALPLMALGLTPEATRAQTWRVVPSVAIGATYSDNVALDADEAARRGWITDLIPGIRIDANAARLKGFLDYRLHEVRYSNARELDSTQHFLTSRATLEAIEKFLFIDGIADISQQNRSPLESAVNVDRPSASSNRIETRTVQLSPFARGQVSDLALYRVRYSASHVSSEGDELSPTRVGEFVGRVRNPSPSAKMGWALDVYSLTSHSDETGTVEDFRARGLLIFGFDPLFNVAASLGRETTDFEGGSRNTTNTYGFAVNWQPSPRAQFAADVEKRFFGTGHSVLASYRTPRTAWRLTSIRDAAVLPGILPNRSTNSVYALLNEILVTDIADPEARADAARRRMDEAGIPATFPLATGFLTSQPLIYEGQTATAALIGTRNTVTIRFTRLDQRGALPDQGTSQSEDLRQSGMSANWAYRLTPNTMITASATALRTEDLGVDAMTTRQKLFSLFLTTQLGPRATASLGVRHAEFESPAPQASYRENAVFGAIQFRL